MKGEIIPIIMCGGLGSRLWPISRQSCPKQFWPLLSNSKVSLFQETLKRIMNFTCFNQPIIVTNERYKDLVQEQIKEINFENCEIILEPEGRNTCPAITLAALHSIERSDNNPALIIFSADHLVKDNKKFELIIKNSFHNIEDNKIYTFGVYPDKPETGYGYIQINKSENMGELTPIKVKKFVEKPKKIDARKFVESGNFLWNSGIFLSKADTIIKQIGLFSPETLKNCKNSWLRKEKENKFLRPFGKTFLKCPNLSIDSVVLEKSNSIFVIPLDIGWSDIGSWDRLWESLPKDDDDNSFKGNVFLEKSKNSYVYAQNRLIVGIGLNNLRIIESDDSILVMRKNRENLLKRVVNNLKKKGFKESVCHNKTYKPWGSYETLTRSNNWQVKEIKVKPGEKLSLQSHYYRSEHWIVVNGTALVEIDDNKKLVKENESVFIPKGSKHRLSNPGKFDINLIEVQMGSLLSEDDIIRY